MAIKNKKLSSTIIKMANKDQKMRLAFQEKAAAWDDKLDERNTKQMKKIVAKFGWPTIPYIGRKASTAAWLLVQHADHDPKFQRKCLTLMQSLPEGEVAKHNLAYLEDRVLVNEGLKQKYGTQFHYSKNGKVKPRSLINKKGLNKRRKIMGLETFEKNMTIMQKMVDKHMRAKRNQELSSRPSTLRKPIRSGA